MHFSIKNDKWYIHLDGHGGEKVYDVSGTPHQHVVGVSKSNKKVTFV